MKTLVNLFIVVLLVSATLVSAKGKYGVIGKIYDNNRATELYGAVISSVEFKTADLVAMLDHVDNYMMFKIKNNEVVVTDDNRNVLTNNKIYLTSSILNYVSKNDAITSNEGLNLVSKSRILELIDGYNAPTIKFEKREKVQTIKAGNSTLEMILYLSK